jgi:hypothetical protein
MDLKVHSGAKELPMKLDAWHKVSCHTCQQELIPCDSFPILTSLLAVNPLISELLLNTNLTMMKSTDCALLVEVIVSLTLAK